MKEVARDVYLLRGFPPNVVNIYLAGTLLVDAGTRADRRRIIRQLAGRRVAAHVLTHVHPDHQGASQQVCEKLGIPLWCGEHDRVAMESGDMSRQFPSAEQWLVRTINHFWTGWAYPVTRALREGDRLGEFLVIETPGHTPGHISLWRASDRLLILGDVLNNISFLTGLPALHEPPAIFTPDPALNRQSLQKVAALRPATICFGHGPPLTDGDKFAHFVASLPD